MRTVIAALALMSVFPGGRLVAADRSVDLMVIAASENESIRERWNAMEALLDRAAAHPETCLFFGRRLSDPAFVNLLEERFLGACDPAVRGAVFEVLFWEGATEPVHFRALLTVEEFKRRESLMRTLIRTRTMHDVALLANWTNYHRQTQLVEDFARRIAAADWDPSESVHEHLLVLFGYQFGRVLLLGRDDANRETVDAALVVVAHRLDAHIRESDAAGDYVNPPLRRMLTEVNDALVQPE